MVGLSEKNTPLTPSVLPEEKVTVKKIGIIKCNLITSN